MVFRYLLQEHLKKFMLILFVSISIYLLATLFERLEAFSKAEVAWSVILSYLFLTLPEILSLILPAVFFLATVIVLAIMAKNKELQALQAGGITPLRLMKYMFILAIFWGAVQIVLAQNIANYTKAKADEIWNIEIRKRAPRSDVITQVWFADDDWIVYVDALHRNGTGNTFVGYRMSENGDTVEEIVSGKSVRIVDENWHLDGVVQSFPNTFSEKAFDKYIMPFERDNSVLFLVEDESVNPADLPIQYLYSALQELVASGTNVEALRTAIHSKIAYAGSFCVLTILAFALLAWRENVYICLAVGVGIVFVFYVSVTVLGNLGASGIVPALVAAWSPHVLLSSFSLYYLLRKYYAS